RAPSRCLPARADTSTRPLSAGLDPRRGGPTYALRLSPLCRQSSFPPHKSPLSTASTSPHAGAAAAGAPSSPCSYYWAPMTRLPSPPAAEPLSAQRHPVYATPICAPPGASYGSPARTPEPRSSSTGAAVEPRPSTGPRFLQCHRAIQATALRHRQPPVADYAIG